MRLRSLLTLLALSGVSLLGRATTLTYTTGNLSFTLPSDPTPSSFTSFDFVLDNVQVTSGATTSSEEVGFGGGPGCGGPGFFVVAQSVNFINCNSVGYNQPLYVFLPDSELFSGPTSAPTLLTGTFPGLVLIGQGNLVVTAPAAVPEPSSFVLLGTGLLGIAAGAKRRFL